MNPPRPHHTSAQVMDILPCDIAVTACGSLVDVYVDTNQTTWHRLRLTGELAASLYRQLSPHLPIRLKDTDEHTN